MRSENDHRETLVASACRSPGFFGVVLAGLALACGGEVDDTPSARTCADEAPRVIVVDAAGDGVLYAARVTGEREGLTGVEYADGDREWVTPERIASWPEMNGRHVTVFIRHAVNDATVLERRGSLFHIRLEDRTDTWVSSDMLFALTPPAAIAPPELPRDPADAPRRRAADRSAIHPGAFVLAQWMSGGSALHGQPYLAEVLGVEGESVRVRFLSDGSVSVVAPSEVFRVFDPASVEVAVGARVFVADAIPVGRVLEMRDDLVKVALSDQERWIERRRVLGSAGPFAPGALSHGTQVTALWLGTTLYHGTIQGDVTETADGAQVTVLWHEGSPPSAVPVEDIVETWTPR